MEQAADRQQAAFVSVGEEDEDDDLWNFTNTDNTALVESGSDSDSSGNEVNHLPAAKRRRLQKMLAMPAPITLSSSDEEDNGNNSDLELLEEVKASTAAKKPKGDDDFFAMPTLQRLPSRPSQRQAELAEEIRRNRDLLDSFKRSSEEAAIAAPEDEEQDEGVPEAGQHSSPEHSEPVVAPEVSRVLLKLRTRDQETRMRIEHTKPFGKLFESFKRHAVQKGWADEGAKITYIFDGDVLKEDDTPADLDVEDDTVIEGSHDKRSQCHAFISVRRRGRRVTSEQWARESNSWLTHACILRVLSATCCMLSRGRQRAVYASIFQILHTELFRRLSLNHKLSMSKLQKEFARLLRTFAREHIPLSGCLRPEHLQGDQLTASSGLRQRLSILQGAGQETREALRQWRGLESAFLRRCNSPLGASQAIEQAALLLRRTVFPDGEPFSVDDFDAQPSTPEEKTAEASRRLDNIAAAVKQDWQIRGTEHSERSDEQGFRQKQLQHMVQEPYEWVYDGLKPMLLDDVLRLQKGMSISLAALYTAVSLRLGFALTPIPVSNAVDQQQLIQAGVTLAVAPSPDAWLLRPEGLGRTCFIDPVKGSVLSSNDCQHRFPSLQQEAPGGAAVVLRMWIGMMRVALVAHQRRGDGDAVAHCLYQLLALDGSAPEWQSALQPAAIATAGRQ